MVEIARSHIERNSSEKKMNFSDNEEIYLVENAKTDAAAFGKLYDKYYDPVFRFILHRTADYDVAKDITSDVFTKVMKKLWTFRWRNVAFSAWLFKVANNEINSYFRKLKYEKVDIENYSEKLSDSSDNADYHISREESDLQEKKVFLELHSVIKKLDVKYQEVIVLRYFEEKSFREIAVIVGKSEGTVKSLVHRGLGYLRKLINPSLMEEL